MGIKNIQQRINLLNKDKTNNKVYYSEFYRLKTDKHKLNSMRNELEFKIKWMQTAREPGSRAGVDNHKAVKSYL